MPCYEAFLVGTAESVAFQDRRRPCQGATRSGANEVFELLDDHVAGCVADDFSGGSCLGQVWMQFWARPHSWTLPSATRACDKWENASRPTDPWWWCWVGLDGQAETCPLPDDEKQIPCGNDKQKGKCSGNDNGTADAAQALNCVYD